MASRIVSNIAGGLALAALVGVVGWIGFRSDEETLTERWFMPGELGHEPGVAPGPLSENAFLTRALGSLGGKEGKIWAANNSLTSRLNFSHNLSRIFPASLYDEHPEFFPLEEGRRIRPPKGGRVWWQPDLGREDVAAYAADKARDYFESKPDAISFALGVNDGLVFGESAETKALTIPVRWFRGRPDYSNLVFTFMNRAAEKLSKTHPDKYVGALAYYWAEQVPDFAVDPQVIPFLTADRSQGYDPQFLAQDRTLQKQWVAALRGAEKLETGNLKAEIGNLTKRVERGRRNLKLETGNLNDSDSNLRASGSGLSPQVSALRSQSSSLAAPPLRLGLYDYLYGSGFLIPRQHPHLLAKHLSYIRRLGFTDYNAEMTPNWGLDGAQPWLVAQLLQDPEQSADVLLDEYYQRYFKEATEPMRRFFERCEEQWMNQPGDAYWLKFYRNETQAILFPPSVCRELRGYLQEAASLISTRSVRARVQQVSDAFEVTERFVAMQTGRDRLNREVLSRTGTSERVTQLLLAFLESREAFVGYTRALQTLQPLLIAPFKMSDYTLHDPVVNTLVWLHENLGTKGQALPLALAARAEIKPIWEELSEPRRSIVRNGSLLGDLIEPRMIAGLSYGVALPKPWISKVEPAEHFYASFKGEEPRTLRLSGSINTSIFQWRPLGQAEFALGGVVIRGQLSPSSSAYLTLAWLDAEHRHLGLTRMLLPTGQWPDWVELSQGGMPPENAAWVGVGLVLRNQRDGDWVEVKEFKLEVR